MNMAISFFVGCLTFILMMFIKVPFKSLFASLAEKKCKNENDRQEMYKRLNSVIIFITLMVSLICYYFVLQLLGETHFKLCCCMKAGAVAIAIYAVFEQWFGDKYKI